MPFNAKACVIAALVAAPPAFAQAPRQTPITAPADRPFAHANSGLRLPPTLAGLPRTTIVDLEAPQLDVTTNYATPDNGEVLTVYVYRSTAGAVPVWFDRAVWQIEHRAIYGKPTRLAGAATFTPLGQATASGMIGAWTTTGSEYRSTALVLVPVGEWLVKFRYSSASLDAAALDQKLRAAIPAIGWPGKIPAAPAAAPIAACPAPLAFNGRAKVVKQNGSAALMGALLAGAANDVAAEKQADDTPRATWCSDPASAQSGAVYRADASADAYLLALSDAGRGVWVTKDLTALLLDKRAKPRWSISLILPGATLTYPPMDRLPAPNDALAALGGSLSSSTQTWGEKREVTIGPGLLK